MLELYHHGSSVCAAKVRLVLAEKGLDWTGHYLDILKGDQFDPEYLKLNPRAVVPTLVHDDKVFVESTVICEYLDDVFPEQPLRPRNPEELARMRCWTKDVDMDLHPAWAAITFVSSHRHTILRLGPEKVKEFLDSTPDLSIYSDWHAVKRNYVMDGFDAPGAADKIRLYDRYLHMMDEALIDSEWIAGGGFSLADTALIPYVNRLDMMSMSGMWEGRLPRVTDWFERVKSRPTFKTAMLDWVPDDLTHDLKTFGRESYKEVKSILGIDN